MQTLFLPAPLHPPPPMRHGAPCTEQRWGLGARHTKCCCPAAHTNQRAICITGAMLMSRSASPPGARQARKDPPRAPWLFGKLFFFPVSPAPIPPQRFPFCVTALPPLDSKCFYRIALHLELLLSWDAGKHFCAGHCISFPVPSFKELTQSLLALQIAPAQLLSVYIYIIFLIAFNTGCLCCVCHKDQAASRSS